MMGPLANVGTAFGTMYSNPEEYEKDPQDIAFWAPFMGGNWQYDKSGDISIYCRTDI